MSDGAIPPNHRLRAAELGIPNLIVFLLYLGTQAIDRNATYIKPHKAYDTSEIFKGQGHSKGQSYKSLL